MNLDNKIKEILQRLTGQQYKAEIWDEAVTEVKKAFEEEAWRLADTDVKLIMEMGYMSGQQWYDKFEKGLLASTDGDPAYNDLTLSIARKAAGL